MSLRRWPKFKGELETAQYWFTAGICSCLLVYSQMADLFIFVSDTVSCSGMFFAIATNIDRCKTEGVVDLFQVVKALRIHKPGAVLTVVCFDTLFKTHYIQTSCVQHSM